MLHGYCPPERYLPYFSWTQIANLPDKPNTVIVLPAGRAGQHGPHLPCAVDTIIAAGVMGHALARLPAAIAAYALAPICYGKSDEHLHFPGTVTEFPSKVLSADGRPACAWTARDFGNSGIIGNPLPATPEQGADILTSLADSWAQGITDLHHMHWIERNEQSSGRAHHAGNIAGP